MQDRFTTISGWVLFAGIIALGSSIVTGEAFHAERPETMGYPIEGVEVEGAEGEAAKPIAFYLASADAAKGEQVFKKCAACHNAEPGGPNALGPALYGVMGNPVAGHPGFAFSPALKEKGGTWDWETMSQWLSNPKKFAPGTKMTFAGISKATDRADLLAYLNAQGSNLPLPTPQAAPAAPAGDPKAAAEKADQPAAGDKAEDEPVLNEQQAGASRTGGDAATSSSGRAGQEKQ